MNIAEQITEQLRPYATGPASSVLMSPVVVQYFDGFLHEWVDEAHGSSVAWIAGAVDDVADYGRVRVVTHYGAILAGEGAER